jgi:hypothetical protein
MAAHLSEYCRRAPICSGVKVLRLVRNDVHVRRLEFTLTPHPIGTRTQLNGCVFLVLQDSRTGCDFDMANI